MTDITPFVDVVLTWSRTSAGSTAILKRRANDLGWDELVRVNATEHTVRGLNPARSYQFAAADVLKDGSLESEDDWEICRIAPLADDGRPHVPAAPTGFAAAQDGTSINFRWAAPSDAVSITLEIRTGSSWEDGTRVADGLKDTSYTWAWWASGSQTFFAKWIDALGRSSRESTSVTVEISAATDHVVIATSDEAAGGFTGTKTHLEVDTGVLRLERIPPFGALTVPFGSLTFPCFAKYWPTGTYESATMNLGKVEKQRLEVALGTEQPIDAGLPFGAIRRPALGKRGRRDGTLVSLDTRSFASRNSWRMTPLTPVESTVEVDTSQTNAGAWDGYRPFVPGTYTFWRCRFRITVTGDGLRFVRIPALVFRRCKFNWKDEGHVVLPGGGPIEVFFGAGFTVAPRVVAGLAAATASNGVKIQATAISATSCFLEAKDGAGTSIAATVDWHALGV